ncbi:MAG: chromosome segregation protein ScpA [Flammeovirgaceae bacterium]|nr:chromosome segregation protein ScpA [Flammeovirgaceae bacterium]MBE61285.1 chromosome segregation protein ScpA [Flammeovirgaceae bacterium]HCX24846.1 chromosome segregation protein ScpA [Cytophagales bacterium]
MSENNTSNTYEIKLPLFEGPFDLLLFFIERDELDIYDIPIAKVTADFLDYIHQLENMNVEVASEFILVAATLMRIKAKMLLPRPVLDEEGNEIDPREELVKHLLEYKRYKSVIAQLNKLEGDRLDREKRGNLMKEIKKLSQSIDVEAEMQDLDLYKLMKVYQKVLKRYEFEKSKPTHQVVQYPYTISGQKDYVLGLLRRSDNQRISFSKMVEEKPEKILVIYNFLAILELLQLNIITLHIGEGFNNFWVEELDGEKVSED